MGHITVLAGTNGAGKSSIGGEILRDNGEGTFYNPDEETRAIHARHPQMTPGEANSLAWRKGRELLERAIAEGKDYAFETTLGGTTITDMLLQAAQSGRATLHIWYCGLSSPELHIKRVQARAAAGGHDIPEEKIRTRYDCSRMNVIKLLPHLTTLYLADNSIEQDLATGVRPRPAIVLSVQGKRIVYPGKASELETTPQWAKPIVFKAIELFGGG
ncbi:MAG: AAA family ATPase [Rhodanobacteraceae bacterium]